LCCPSADILVSVVGLVLSERLCCPSADILVSVVGLVLLAFVLS